MTARERIAGNVANYVDERTGAAKWMKKNLTKVFPDHWSFLLGEIALYSFIILLLSGTFLTFWFDPSQREVIYEGSYEPLNGIEMSAAYASTLDISFEVRGGLLMRQIHHWAALIFMAAIVVHLMRSPELVSVSRKQLFKRSPLLVHICRSSPSAVHSRVKLSSQEFTLCTF
jgi:ubiquinol-cytochrome c reductase cytochrome b subunit